MGRKYKRLFDELVSERNFRIAYEKTRRGKRSSLSYLDFKEYAALNLERLREQVAAGEYEMAPFRQFYIHDPKTRLISGLPFKDRVVQHALNNILEPIFERAFLPYTFACRPGRGTHAGVKHVQSALRRTGATHVLKTDFSKYFPSIDLMRLHGIYAGKIKCARTLDLKARITPTQGTGVPIGSLTSQLDANVYGSRIDHFVHHEIKPLAWARYMDDIVLLSDDPAFLRAAKDRMAAFAREEMGMAFSKWQVAPISRGVNFLGYRIWPRHKLLRKHSVQRAKCKIRALTRRGDAVALERFLSAWIGHARWADVENLMRTLETRYGDHQFARRPRRA